MRIPFISSRPFKTYSLGNRLGSWNLLITTVFFILGAAISIVLWYLSKPPAPSHVIQDIQGIWYSDYRFSTPAGFVRVRGTTEYFPNMGSNFLGEMSSTKILGKERYEFTYDINASDDWQATDTDLTIRVSDVKSQFTHMAINSARLKYLPPDLREKLEQHGLEYQIPKGMSERFHIVHIDGDTMYLVAKDLLGNPFQIVAKRVSRRFSFT